VRRTIGGFGHTEKLMAPKFVAPYRKSGKKDGNDAEQGRNTARENLVTAMCVTYECSPLARQSARTGAHAAS
jgi:hypothetical protein